MSRQGRGGRGNNKGNHGYFFRNESKISVKDDEKQERATAAATISVILCTS